jgi:hypothetical protein
MYLRKDDIVAVVPADNPQTSYVWLRNFATKSGNALGVAETTMEVYQKIVIKEEESDPR